MNYASNPYTSGPPVQGEDFYGRESDIQKVLNTKHRSILFIATRRIGKTSLCHQIKYICETESKYSDNLCVAWNLQGKRDVPSARRRLCSDRNLMILNKVDRRKLESISACHEVIQAFCDPYQHSPEKKTIILMMDEPDILLHFAERGEHDFLIDLKDTFGIVPNLRVVMVSPPRIQNLTQYHEIPYLFDDFQIYFVREFDDSEAEDLVRLKKRVDPVPLKFLENGEHTIKNIIEVSNRVPFYIQHICSNIFDSSPDDAPSEVIERMIEHQVFSPYFTSDFSEMHPFQKIMLLNLANSQESQEDRALIEEARDVIGEIEDEVPTHKHIDNMLALGILKKNEENRYYIANRLFDRWILRDFENHWNSTLRRFGVKRTFTKKKLSSGSLKRKDLEQIEVDLKAFKAVFEKLDQDFDDAKTNDPFYYKKRLSLVRDQGLLIRKLQDHLSTHGAESLCKVLESIKQGADDSVISQHLKSAKEQGQTKGWGKILSGLGEEGSTNRVAAIVDATFKVATYLIENNT